MRSFQHWIFVGIGLLIILMGCGEPPESDVLEDIAVENSVISEADESDDESFEDDAEEMEEDLEDDDVEEMEGEDEPEEDESEEMEEESEEEMEEDAPPPTPEPTPLPPPTEEAAPPPTPEPKPFDFTQVPPQIMNGETAVIAGTAPNIGGDVTVELVAGPHLLAEGTSQVNDNGDWQVELSVPYSVYGAGRVQALSEAETAVRPIAIRASDSDPLDVAINGVQPFPDTVAVAGAPLFFSGNVKNAINGNVTVSFWINDCTEQVANQPITLGNGAEFWNALIYLPQNLADDRGCASIATGSAASGNWREHIIPVEILQLNDEEAEGFITIGNRPDQPFRAGTSIYLFGTALNLPEPFIEIDWIGEGDNPVFLITTTNVDDFGYWDAEIDIPEGLSGQTRMIISSGEGEAEISTEFTVPVNP